MSPMSDDEKIDLFDALTEKPCSVGDIHRADATLKARDVRTSEEGLRVAEELRNAIQRARDLAQGCPSCMYGLGKHLLCEAISSMDDGCGVITLDDGFWEY